ncbi:Phosphotransferase enzyme family protein [Shimia gijangensis]|uniref:Phosphotransferase enzyme family protein n=1 Tax=Shimia gijangensis TaxID=1470563 RepID=A0A1M6QKL7_9RHOB|nr:phosphotransferase [Shimia gijangensis]SHK20792.1 Phosphotransferase enzyme family protein [Shimia gijangensis]
MDSTLEQTFANPPTLLVDAIVAKFDWAKGASWTLLSGGRTNFAWKLSPESGGAAAVVKLYRGPALNPLFPNDPKSEALLLKLLLGTGLAPKPLASLSTEVGECNVYSHIPGETWRRDTSIVGKLMQGLHCLTAPNDLQIAPSGSRALGEKTESILVKCDEKSSILRERPNEHVLASQRQSLLHGDIVPGNLIWNETGLHLIDWQCPSIGDPCEDIAIFLSPAMQSLYRGSPLLETEIADFFEAYDDPVTETRYRSLAPWYHWRMAAYCLWQSQNGRPDYAEALELEIDALQRSRTR